MSGAGLSALVDRVKALEETVEDLVSGGTATLDALPPSNQARLEAHARCRVLESELETAVLRIKELEESVEDLLHGEAGDTDVAVRSEEPEIRVRISHAHTLKDGWRCDSTTVEWTGRGEPDWDAMEDRLKRTHLLGIAEAAMRNQDDGVAAAARDNVKALAS